MLMVTDALKLAQYYNPEAEYGMEIAGSHSLCTMRGLRSANIHLPLFWNEDGDIWHLVSDQRREVLETKQVKKGIPKPFQDILPPGIEEVVIESRVFLDLELTFLLSDIRGLKTNFPDLKTIQFREVIIFGFVDEDRMEALTDSCREVDINLLLSTKHITDMEGEHDEEG